MNQSGRKATRNTVWRTLLCSFDDEHQQHYPGRTMLVAFSILTLLDQLNFLSISAWHVQTYFHSNLVRFVLRGIPAFLSILLIFCAVRIMKPKVELGQWLRWPPQHVWGRRLTDLLQFLERIPRCAPSAAGMSVNSWTMNSCG